jgi:hypothetical protein
VTGTITYDNVISLLLEAIPEFHPDCDDVTENLVYLVFPDLMRFAKRELVGKQNEQLLERTFAFLEEAAQCRDARVTEMLRDALHDLAIPDPDTPRSFMGPATRRLFRKVEKEIYK